MICITKNNIKFIYPLYNYYILSVKRLYNVKNYIRIIE